MPDVSPETLSQLKTRARQACEQAYCPYSKFKLGAALITASGQIFSGCNVENASYGLSICGERNAIFHMVAAGEREFTAIVIYTPTPTPTTPCGACRQVLHEFGREALVVSYCDGPDVLTTSVAELFPDAFGPKSLA